MVVVKRLVIQFCLPPRDAEMSFGATLDQHYVTPRIPISEEVCSFVNMLCVVS